MGDSRVAAPKTGGIERWKRREQKLMLVKGGELSSKQCKGQEGLFASRRGRFEPGV